MKATNSTLFNCSMRPYIIEIRLGEHLEVFFIMATFLVIVSVLAWVLHNYKNNLPAHKLTINVFLNIMVVDTLAIMMYLVVIPAIKLLKLLKSILSPIFFYKQFKSELRRHQNNYNVVF